MERTSGTSEQAELKKRGHALSRPSIDEQAGHLAEAQRIVIDAIGRAFALYGVPIALGRVFALLFVADGPLSVTEAAARLELTKSTTSVNLRLLEHLRLVRQVWPARRRGKFYVAERDFKRIVAELLRTIVAAELALVIAALDDSERHLRRAQAGPDAAVAEQARSDHTRIEALREFYGASTRLLEQFIAASGGAHGQPGAAANAPLR
ncbi:MAG: MarR family transcriptional regulator [Dehalococcoidales bacterium]|nr:MarR family transcriptional regulator [Dehalococcoidales bacterium]